MNDDYKIAKIVKADGCHIGQLDGDVSLVRNYLKGKNNRGNLPQLGLFSKKSNCKRC